MELNKTIVALSCFCVCLCLCCRADAQEIYSLKSPDGLNEIRVLLDDNGGPRYRVTRQNRLLIGDSPMGLRCEDEDFTRQMTVHQVGSQQTLRQEYRLFAGNQKDVSAVQNHVRIALKNERGSVLLVDLAAGNEGVAFRYSIEGRENSLPTVVQEATGFNVPPASTAWLQPYHAAGRYTPAYEDFYFRVRPGDKPPQSRQTPRGWSLPGLFRVASAQSWMLIAESGTDASYCACHLEGDPSSKNMYRIAFAYDDEATSAKSSRADAVPAPVVTRTTPWRIIVTGSEAKDILNSTLVTDLATPCKIDDASWIRPGRASWSWWSHPEDKDTNDLYNSFTDLAARFGWEYTLFDAGWWEADLAEICRYAASRGVSPLIWLYAGDFYDTQKRRQKLDELVESGIKGIKVDFWCSDRQETMRAMHETLADAADRKLVVSFHGCTVPRGWHRTWPNLLTAEAVLGAECYFYESRYPEKAAELNTILPFTRNVMGPMDSTPVALTVRKFARKTTAVHELAASIVFTSGLIHYADSVEAFTQLPEEIRGVLTDAPAVWDQTICLSGMPGHDIVLARRTGRQWFVAGLNGTDKPARFSIDLAQFGPSTASAITEGDNPLMDFSIRTIEDLSTWKRLVPPYGGFVLRIESEQ